MNEQSFEYRTGQTQPAKSNRGLIVFLLICVIFLAGLVSLLGIMNIQLLSLLQDAQEDTPVSFAQGGTDPTQAKSNGMVLADIQLQELSELYQQMYELPAGLYVVDAPEDSPVVPGDVLVRFGHTAVPTLSLLQSLYNSHTPGEEIPLTFHRDGQTFTHTITLGE